MEYRGLLMYRRSEEGKKQRKIAKKTLGKDYTPFQSKQPVLLDTQTMNTLTGALTKDNLIVLGSVKSTPTRSKYMKGNLMDTKIMETSPELTPQTYQTLICSWEGSLAKHFQLPVNEVDLTTPEGRSFLKSLGFSETKDPDILCLKTSKVYLIMTLGKLSRQYLGFSPKQGMAFHGVYIIPKTMVSHKTGKGSTLLDVLENEVDEKYFLSDKMVKHILTEVEGLNHKPNPHQQ